MKQNLLLLAAICCIATGTFATTHTITTSNFMFSPSSGITVNIGDTVKWVLASGTHTSTSTTIPSGAASWDVTLSSTPFIYVPTVVGTYSFHCTIHSSMTGSFTVVNTTGVTHPATTALLFNMFPNPASSSVKLQFSQNDQPVSVLLTDMSGKAVLSKEYAASAEANIDIKNIPAGIYFVTAKQNGNEYKQQLQVAH